jgi:predicted ABC-type ATPase
VPDTKIVERYFRSLKLLPNAIRYSNRAFLFDSSAEEPWYFAEFTDGGAMDIKGGEIPHWFEPAWNQFQVHPRQLDGERG